MNNLESSIYMNLQREQDIYTILQSYRIQRGLALKEKAIQEEAIKLLDELQLITRLNDKIRKTLHKKF